MKKTLQYIIIALGIVITVVSLIQAFKPNPEVAFTSYKGFTYSPKSYNKAQDIENFYQKTKQSGNIVGWYGDWLELADQQKAPYVITEQAKKYNLKTLVIVTPFNQTTGELLRDLTIENKDAYFSGLRTYLQKYQPEYLGIGIEVNYFANKAPDKLDQFVELFNDTYNITKVTAPLTKIFTVFQYEHLKGLQGGLFGNNPNVPADWEFINKFNKADLYAFTTYPMLVFQNPEDIPADYYSEIKKHTDKPVAFTEIGWLRTAPDNLIQAGWDSSPEEQARFITRFFDLTKELNPRLMIWSFLYDQAPVTQQFNSCGLFSSAEDFTNLAAWDAWLSAK